MKLFAFLSLTIVLLFFSALTSYGQQQDPGPSGPSMTPQGELNAQTIGASSINCISTQMPGLTHPETGSGRMSIQFPLRDWKFVTAASQAPPG